jgi:1-phosphatidylinositol-4-phosphate 5-kinase
MIKTISKGEMKVMLDLLPAYGDHFKSNPDSLLSKCLGVFTVKSSQTGAVHIMLMENVLRYKNKDQLRYVFDLKGSTVDRDVTGSTNPKTVLKD